mmetsp:Transcript_35595/g.45897  ORF Transcript_35595/g.45897 Transcript_35595/m.45897 type:complete len:336 (+) Transcript_35595:219-1226(+)
MFRRVLEDHDRHRNEPIVISHASSKTRGHLERHLRLSANQCVDVREVKEGSSFVPFEWKDYSEHEGIVKAVEHLSVQLKKFEVPLTSANDSEGKYDLLNVSNDHSLLNIETDSIKISGGTDAIIVPSRMLLNKQQQICSIFELKTHLPDKIENNIPSQLVVEAIAAQMNSRQPVLSIYTDLSSDHAFGVVFDKSNNAYFETPLLFHSLSAMASYVSIFLAKYCEPKAVIGHSRGDFGDHGRNEKDYNDDDDDGGDDDDDAGSGGGGRAKKAKLSVANMLNEKSRGDVSLAHEHFNDFIDETEPLSEERATLVNHLLQSYGYLAPSYHETSRSILT